MKNCIRLHFDYIVGLLLRYNRAKIIQFVTKITITCKLPVPDIFSLIKILSALKLRFPNQFFSTWPWLAIIIAKIRILERKKLNV